ncbi:G-protein coupled receptor 39-like [Babylonia areolata]|uniref:G-protein coupled receptor 39-like n=1 Tax=Babylonia areolata TaxID=304850 RepID=UPI003FD19EA8
MYPTKETDETSFPEYKSAMIIGKIWTPVILLAGGFGNVATVFVMSRVKKCYPSQQVFYLIALAVVDFLLLCIGALHEWVIDVFDVDVAERHTVVCKLHTWLLYALGTMSAWLVTCVTVQRTIAISLPHRARTMFTVRRTRMAVAAVVLTSSALHFHMVVSMETDPKYGCIGRSVQYEDFFFGVWTWVDMCMSSILPFLCLIVCDVMLSMSLFKATSIRSPTIQSIRRSSTQHNNDQRKAAFKTTVMILALSITFIVLTLPVK